MRTRFFFLLEEGRVHEANEATQKVEEEENIDRELEGLLLELGKFTEEAAMAAEHEEQAAFKTLSIITVIAAVVSGFLAWMVIRTIANNSDGHVLKWPFLFMGLERELFFRLAMYG